MVRKVTAERCEQWPVARRYGASSTTHLDGVVRVGVRVRVS
tara:strand:+ start:144 stop:266 length:123 start_codon:yes stop_codon:yes gene_type:complete